MDTTAETGGVPSLAAVLFTDLVGSTALRSRVGEDVAEAVRRRHDMCLTEAVMGHAGRVVKGVGDGVMAVFPGASEAVASAVVMQQEVRRIAPPGSPEPLRIRVGIGAGEVTWEEGDCFGTPVVEAARLCAAAEGGQILTSDVVRVLCGSRAVAPFTPRGELDLKGLPVPVTAWSVDWEVVGPRVQLPAGLAAQSPLSFVGRLPELEALLGAWERTRGGERRVVIVAGEPGIGKTRLVAEFARRVAEQQAAVLYGRAEEELGMPYAPFVEALDGYVRSTPPLRLAAQLGPLGGELTRLVPGLGARVASLPEPLRAEPETERYRLFAAVAEFVGGIAADRPLLLALDDLQWATAPDVLLLGHLVRVLTTTPALILVAYRDTEIGVGHPLASLLGELPRSEGAERIHLAGIGDGDVGRLVVNVTGRSLDDNGHRLASAVRDETGGNPLFVGEVLLHLAEVESDRASGWDLRQLGVPEGVREVIGRRIARLPEGAAEVLAAASVIGSRFDLELLLTLTDDAALTLDLLSAAEAAALLAPEPDRPGSYRFAHSLIQETLYDGLPSARRLALHRSAGLALERLPGGDERLGELARHFAVAAPLGEVDRAVDYATRAGDHARAALAFEQAALLYESALDIACRQSRLPLELRCDLQTSLGEVLHRAGDPRHRDALFTAAAAARELGDSARLARAALAMNLAGEFPPLGDVDQNLIGLAEEALTAVGDTNPALRARLLALLGLELMFSADQARRLASSAEAVRLAREIGDRTTLARVLVSTHWGGATADNVRERLDQAAELVSLGRELGDLEAVCWGELFRFEDCLAAADLAGALAGLGRAEELARQLHQPVYEWEARYRRACLALLAGRLEEAERLVFEALELGTANGGIARPALGMFSLQLGRLRFEQGRTGEILAASEAAVAQQPDIALSWLAALALFYSECGDDDRARDAFERAAATDFVGMGDHAWIEGVALSALVAARLGEREQIETLYRRLAPYSSRVNFPRAFVEEPFDYPLAILATELGRYDAAEDHLCRAEDICRRMQAPTSLTRVHLERARMLHARGRPGDESLADALAQEALGTAEELGLARVVMQARQVLGELSRT